MIDKFLYDCDIYIYKDIKVNYYTIIYIYIYILWQKASRPKDPNKGIIRVSKRTQVWCDAVGSQGPTYDMRISRLSIRTQICRLLDPKAPCSPRFFCRPLALARVLKAAAVTSKGSRGPKYRVM